MVLEKYKIFKNAWLLSGGEKIRLGMLIASRQQNCLLLLDEPNNHLDISRQDTLSDALLRYNSSFILVSHCQKFVAKYGTTRRYSMT